MMVLAVALAVDTTMVVVLLPARLESGAVALAVGLLLSPAAGRSLHAFLGGKAYFSNEKLAKQSIEKPKWSKTNTC
jgi:hypothetical protein